MLTFNTSILSKEDTIVQKITVKNCITDVEMLYHTLKKFPFNAYVTRSENDENSSVKETFIYIHHNHEVSFDTLSTTGTIVRDIIVNCQNICLKLSEFNNAIDALAKDCKQFEHETTESNKPTAKKECYLRQSRK